MTVIFDIEYYIWNLH